jgi:hypothetical protein
MTPDEMVVLLSVAAHVACQQLTPPYLDALHASVERASCLPARPDWERKAAAHAELFTMLGGVTGDRDLARLMSSATLELRACDADGAAREVERHLRGLQFMGRLACGASSARTGVCC